VISDTAEHKATIDGSATVSLSGEHAGMKWATNGASWGYLINGEELNQFGAGLEPSFKVELVGSDISLLAKIGGNGVEFLCTSVTTTEGKLKAEGALLASLAFHGCITKINGVTQAKCEPKANGISKGVIETLKLKGLVSLHTLGDGTKDSTVLIEPDTGSNALAHIEVGEICSLGENVLLGGKLSLKDAEGAFATHKVSHSIEEFSPLTHLWVISDTAEHKATIDGSATVSLSGEHAGMKWAGSPG
jgi:hypothetical protein